MQHNIKHEIVSEDGLRRETYRYWFNDDKLQLVLDWYAFDERPTKRHKFVLVTEWNQYRGHYNHMDREQIPQREEVREVVLKQFIELITVE